jgi:hypothetical protein
MTIKGITKTGPTARDRGIRRGAGRRRVATQGRTVNDERKRNDPQATRGESAAQRKLVLVTWSSWWHAVETRDRGYWLGI